ncbi:TrmH family RNA methyltransferase, partial [Campylobacter sp.]|uniref:TrmH family RNA methyltransferase n=1 Tax=Campylobacter sp. TaxID=205 RepID=UPI002A5B1F8C
REDAGLPLTLLKENQNRCITIPMSPEGRSLNLATSVGIITYEAIRQNFKHFNLRKSTK